MGNHELQDQQLEEYKALRAEILALHSRRVQRLAVAWAGISALIGAGAVSSTPELGWLALTLAASAWVDDLHNSDSMMRVATYIEVYLESSLPGLNWETVRARSDELRSRNALSFRRIGHGLLSNYAVFVSVCLLATVLMYFIHPSESTPRLILSIVLAGFSVIAIVRAAVEITRSPRHSEKWRRHFLEIKNADPSSALDVQSAEPLLTPME